MIAPQRLALAALLLAFLPDVLAMDQDSQLKARAVLEKRGYDSYKVYERKRNAHACIMSIVFMVLYPLGAISVRLPVQRIPFLRNTYLRNKVPAMHAPIQLLALVMMIGGMALGIRVAQDLGYLGTPVHAHVVIGLFVTCTIIVIQPLLGVIQHRYFKKTGRFSAFGQIHRWVGRTVILLLAHMLKTSQLPESWAWYGLDSSLMMCLGLLQEQTRIERRKLLWINCSWMTKERCSLKFILHSTHLIKEQLSPCMPYTDVEI